MTPRAGRRRVGVNLLWLVPGVVGGTEEYATRLLDAIAADAPDDLDLVLFALRQFPDAHPALANHFETVIAPIDGSHRVVRVAIENTWLPRELRRRDLSLVHHAGGRIPSRTTVPAVVTIHDLQPLELPQNFSHLKRLFLGRALPRSAARAEMVMTPSAYVQRLVTEHLGVPAPRTAVVSAPVRQRASVAQTATTPAAEALIDSGRPFFLYPAITYPHKNHSVLIDAFAIVSRARPDVRLVLTGGEGPDEAAVRAQITRTGLDGVVERTGRVPRGDLDALIAAATALVFPSRYEGFGMPVLEAMAAGCPVIVADATALPEVVGDTGVLVGPDDVDGWAKAMLAQLDVPRATAGDAGRARSDEFSRANSAAALLTVYRRAMDSARVG